MPVNKFSVGRDLTFSIILPGTGAVSINGTTEYAPKRVEADIKHKGLDGLTQHGIIPDGWELSIKFDRQDPNIDNLIASIEDGYFNGQNIPSGTITETIQEDDGSVSQFQYTNVCLSFPSNGNWKGDALVNMEVKAYASRRKRLT